MKEDIFKGKWKQIRGRAKEWRGKLTGDGLDKIDGRFYQMIGKLEKKYSYSELEAEAELKRFFDKLKARIKV